MCIRDRLHADEIVSFGGAELAAELGALSADHLLQASDAGIRAMADAGVVATLPVSYTHLGNIVSVAGSCPSWGRRQCFHRKTGGTARACCYIFYETARADQCS